MEFYILETISKLLCDFSEKENMYDLSPYQLMLCGSLTGFFSSFIYTPIEYAKIQSQVSKHSNPQGSLSRIS